MKKGVPDRLEARRLLDLSKRATADIRWKFEQGSWRVRVRSSAIDEDALFTLVGCVGRTNHSFTLLDASNIPLAKFTKHGPHRIAGVLFSEPHKHIWDGETENGSLTYIPPDIDPDDDLNDQFIAFSKECNIELLGNYQRCSFLRTGRVRP